MPKIPAAILLPLALAASAPMATAAPQEKLATIGPAAPSGIDVDYTISFWTLPFGHTSFDARFGGGTYRTSSHFETSGIVSAFWGATIDASSSGRIARQTVLPSAYDSYYRRSGKKKTQRVAVSYGADRIPVTFADPPYDTKRFPVTDDQKKDTFDPLSAVTYVLSATKTGVSNPCGATIPVFDGRRRYDIALTYIRDEPVKLENGLFDGRARLCQLHYNQIAGFKQKILKEGRALPPMYGLFAEIPSASAPNGHYIVALKVWASTGFGTVTAMLNRMTLNRADPQG